MKIDWVRGFGIDRMTPKSRNGTDTRYALAGIFIRIGDDGHMEFVSSDTHRLSHVNKPTTNRCATTQEGIVLVKGMMAIAGLAESVDEISIAMTANTFYAVIGDAAISVRLIEGMFPSMYGELISNPGKNSITVNRKEFLHNINTVGLMANAEKRAIYMNITDGEMFINADNNAGGGGGIQMGVKLSGEELEIGANHLFLADGLRAMSGKETTLRYGDERDMIHLREGDFTYLLAPIAK